MGDTSDGSESIESIISKIKEIKELSRLYGFLRRTSLPDDLKIANAVMNRIPELEGNISHFFTWILDSEAKEQFLNLYERYILNAPASEILHNIHIVSTLSIQIQVDSINSTLSQRAPDIASVIEGDYWQAIYLHKILKTIPSLGDNDQIQDALTVCMKSESLTSVFKEIIEDFVEPESEITELFEHAEIAEIIDLVNDSATLPWNIVSVTASKFGWDENVRTAIVNRMSDVAHYVNELLIKYDFETVFYDILADEWEYESSDLGKVLRNHAKEIISYLDEIKPDDEFGFGFEDWGQYKYKVESKLYESGVDVISLRDEMNPEVEEDISDSEAVPSPLVKRIREPTPAEIHYQIDDMGQLLQDAILSKVNRPFTKPIVIMSYTLANEVIKMKWGIEPKFRRKYKSLFKTVRTKCKEFLMKIQESGSFSMIDGTTEFLFEVIYIDDIRGNLVAKLLQIKPHRIKDSEYEEDYI